MLLLFDIDLTLITTGGAGIRAMTAAGREVFGPGFTAEGVSYAGRLDPLIISDMLRVSGLEDTPAAHRRLREVYLAHLARELELSAGKRALPGVHQLLAGLDKDRRERADLTLGLLTGNFEATGRMKLAACGIDTARFTIAAWGDDSPHTPPRRDHLVPVALARDAARRGGTLAGERVTIIGDTPHDVACAKAHGCRALGVATGRTPIDELRGAGADLAVPDLSDTKAIRAWLLDR